MLAVLMSDLPPHAPPRFWGWFLANLRLQILFMLVPVMMILLLRDLGLALVLWGSGMVSRDSHAEPLILLGSSAFVFVTAPVVLAVILRTEPLVDSPLPRVSNRCARSRG